MNYTSNNYYPYETINQQMEAKNYTYNPYINGEVLHLAGEIEFLNYSVYVYIIYYTYIYTICFILVTAYFELLDFLNQWIF